MIILYWILCKALIYFVNLKSFQFYLLVALADWKKGFPASFWFINGFEIFWRRGSNNFTNKPKIKREIKNFRLKYKYLLTFNII